MKLSSQEIGRAAEKRARDFFRSKGYRLLAKNYRTRTGEIDLIVSRKAALVFVEVRFRSQDDFGSGAESVHWHKQQRLIRAAEHYLQHQVENPEKFTEFRFDVLCMDDGIEWIESAFTLD